MSKILSISEAIHRTNQLSEQGKKIVLVGGCFDILHIGHIALFENAKKYGDSLFILLESDENIKKIKGSNRPINEQKDRAKILTHLDVVDYIVPLKPMQNNSEYDELVISLKPAIIATTKGDKSRFHKERQAEKIGAKVLDVTGPVSNHSTTKLIEVLNEI